MNRQLLAVLGIFVLIGIVVGVWTWVAEPNLPQAPPEQCPNGITAISGFVSSEKREVMADADVQQVFSELCISVDYKLTDSQDRDLDTVGADFVWTSDVMALAKYEDKYGPPVAVESILPSPLVIVTYNYETISILEALRSSGYVSTVGEVETLDICAIANDMLSTPWRDFGVDRTDTLYINTADGVTSSLGALWLILYGTAINDCQGLTAENIDAVLPRLQAYHSAYFAERDALALFKSVLSGSIPAAISYENLVVGYKLANPDDQARLDRVDVLYTNPTIWATHPFIGITENGALMSLALQNPRVQRAACNKYGFRTVDWDYYCSVIDWGLNDVALSIPGAMNLPRYEVYERIVAGLDQ